MLGASATSLGRLFHVLIIIIKIFSFHIFLFTRSIYNRYLWLLEIVRSDDSNLVLRNVITFLSQMYSLFCRPQSYPLLFFYRLGLVFQIELIVLHMTSFPSPSIMMLRMCPIFPNKLHVIQKKLSCGIVYFICLTIKPVTQHIMPLMCYL